MSSSDENAVRISGTAADTPVLRYTGLGTPEAHFSLGCRQTFRDRAGRPFVKTLHVCVAGWHDVAIEIVTHVKRGRPVAVEGYLSRDDPRTASDRRAGIVVVAQRIETAASDEPRTASVEQTALPLDGNAK
jgi:single-stranded DNA-binding protein